MAITKTGKVIIKLSAARWKDFLPNMGKKNYDRLVNSGIIKPEAVYINGINRGTVNILKRLGYTRGNIDNLTQAQLKKAQGKTQNIYSTNIAENNQIEMKRNQDALFHLYSPFGYGQNPIVFPGNPQSWQRAATIPYGKTLHVKNMDLPAEFKASPEQRLMNAIINRHEAYEAVAAEKAIKNYLKNPAQGDKKAIASFRQMYPQQASLLTDQQILSMNALADRAVLSVKTPGKFGTNLGTQVGSHTNMDVLGKERKLVDTYPYQDNKAIDFFRNTLRKDEYRYMDRAGEYAPRQAPGNILSRIFSRIKNKFGSNANSPVPSLERYNKQNYRQMVKKMKNKVPVEVNRGEYWTPLY